MTAVIALELLLTIEIESMTPQLEGAEMCTVQREIRQTRKSPRAVVGAVAGTGKRRSIGTATTTTNAAAITMGLAARVKGSTLLQRTALLSSSSSSSDSSQ